MAGKRRLGRGLGALIPEVVEDGTALREIEIAKVRRNPFQPRMQFDQEKLEELADSIKEHGVVQPIIACPEKEGYVLVAGERRLRAAQLAGLKTLPALIRELDSSMMLQIALIENLQREDLNPIEEAVAYQQLIEEFNYTQEGLARRLGKSRSAVANTVRLLSLPDEVKQSLIDAEISEGQARPLLGIADKEEQIGFARRIIKEKLTAREVEKAVAGRHQKRHPQEKGKKKATAFHAPEAILADLRERLQHHLGTKVKITRRSGGGTIEIDFFELEDLERLISLIMPKG